MNMNKLTIAQASLLDPEDRAEVRVRDLDIDQAARLETAKLWVHLTGIDHQAARLVSVVMNEGLNDGELMVMLNGPASAFLTWFRRTDWEVFALYEATDYRDDWGWDVLDTARAMRDALGNMAHQVPLRRPGMAS